MAGLVLDIILTFLFKGTIRVFRFFRSSKWERCTAMVTGQVVQAPNWGCSSVKLYYRFSSNGCSTKGWDEIPFYARSHARYYAKSFSHNLPRTIRVNPKNPQETLFFERDQ
jgi:hypothetical protein